VFFFACPSVKFPFPARQPSSLRLRLFALASSSSSLFSSSFVADYCSRGLFSPVSALVLLTDLHSQTCLMF